MQDPCKPYRLMALNNAWANATLLSAMAGLDDAAFAAKRPGFFPSLKATLNHVLQVDLYYVDALKEGGQGQALRALPDHASVAALAAAQADSDLALARFCQGLTPEMLGESRITQRPDGAQPEQVEMLLLHLFQHQVHHRGQAHVQLQSAGIAPPQLDEFYLDYDRAPSARAYFG